MDKLPAPVQITQLIREADNGDEEAKHRLLEAVYEDLRRLAGHLMKAERPAHTLQATALVNEYMVRVMAEPGNQGAENRSHLISIAAKAMRHLLVDHAKGKQRGKRGAGIQHCPIQTGIDGVTASDEKLLLIHDAMDRLAELNERQARVAELRIFGGFSISEIAQSLHLTARTIDRDWLFAKGFLQMHLQ